MAKKEKIIDKVKLEKIIDEYLSCDIPLSLFLEKYDLTFPQMQLLFNRIRGFTRQSEKIANTLGDYNIEEYNDESLIFNHEIPEKYPLNSDKVKELFARLEELKEKLKDKPSKEKITSQITELEKKIASYDKNILKRIEEFLQEIENMTDIDSNDILFLLCKHGIKPQDLDEYSKLYEEYKSDCALLEELKSKFANYLSLSKEYLSYEKEYQEIREELVLRNIKLVNWCIRKFFNNIPLPKSDTQMVGLEGLVRAIDKFDYKLNFMFSSYAVKAIVHNIERHFSELYGMSWEDFIAKDSIRYYRSLMREMDPDRKTDISPKELSEMGLIGLSARKIAEYDEMLDAIIPFSDVYPEMEYSYRATRKFEMPFTFEDYEDIDSYEDMVSIESLDSDEEKALTNIYKGNLKEVISTLSDREKKVLTLRYGLEDGIERSLREIGKIIHVGPERVRQIEAKALWRLRHPTRARKLLSVNKKSFNPSLLEQSLEEKITRKITELCLSGINPKSIIKFLNMNGCDTDHTNLIYYLDFIKSILLVAKESNYDCMFVREIIWEKRDILLPYKLLKTICENYVTLEEYINNCLSFYWSDDGKKLSKKIRQEYDASSV